MTATVLSDHRRKAAHARHRCVYCGRNIAARETYLDQRIADEGTVYTVRAHLTCHSAYWSWDPDPDATYGLQDLSDGHLPPCPMAWDRGHTECTCEVHT